MTDEEQKAVFAKNLNKYLRLSNKSQKEVADSIGVLTSTFNTWCQGVALPRMGKVQKLADYFGIGKSDLIDDKPFSNVTTKKGVVINVLGRVAAGIPIEAVEDVIDTEEITEEMAATGTYFGLQIKGDSMVPNICNHDIVIVRQQDDAETGDTVIALVNGDDATCKRLKKYHDGIELIPNNPNFQPIYFSNEEIQSKPVRIIGKVVELRRKF